MPEKPRQAANYFKQMEDGDRVNARVADKVMVALPKELNEQQRVDLVRGFANDVTKGRAPWVAAIHDKGKDAGNPHAHILIRDRCPDSGKRVIGMSDAGSTDMLREKWEQHANRALEQAGHAARIDRRSLQAQGIDRAPTIHEGPNVRAMEKRGARPTSRMRGRRNGRGARRPMRQIDYPSIDKGQSRPEYNRSLKAPESEADYWNAVDEDAQRREFEERGLGADYWRAQKAGQRPASVHGVGGSTAQPQQGDQVRGVPLLDSPLGVPSGLPGRAVGVGPSPAALKPTAQRVSGRQGKDETANNFAKRPVGAKLSHEHPEAGNVKEHTDSIGLNSQSGKEGVMADRDDWLGRQHAARLDAAQLKADQSRGRFDDLMKRSYLNPAGAEKAMDDYRNKHGEPALYDRMNKQTLGSPAGHGMKFGLRPGSILSTDGLKKGAGDRQLESLDTRRQIPDAYREMHRDREALRAAKQTDENFKARQTANQPAMAPDAPKQGEPQQAQPASSQPHAAQQHHGLEQPGQPQAGAPARLGPDWSRMSPEKRQAYQHHGLVQPRPMSARPNPSVAPAAANSPIQQVPMTPNPAGAAAPLARPVMAPAPGKSGGQSLTPSPAKKKGMEL